MVLPAVHLDGAQPQPLEKADWTKDVPKATLPPPKPAPDGSAAAGATASPFAGASVLSVEALVEQVLARSPSLPQMVAAGQAASARVPQVTSLDDPLFGATVSPAAWGVPIIPDGYRLELFQRFPWPGKLRVRGEAAQAEASAVGRDIENVRQQLNEAARDSFYEYYLITRSTEFNADALVLLRRALKTAEDFFRTGKVKQQDVLLLQVEIGRLQNRSILLERQREVVVARMNALMHLPPDSPLPPPKEIAVEGELPDPKELRAQAFAQRLDLLALADRMAAARASLELARLDYYPDFDVMAAYDAFWGESEQRPQVAVRVNLPIRRSRRQGAVAEAQARLTELQAQLARQQDQVGFEVQQAYAQWRESLRTVRLFEKDVLPPARLNVSSSSKAYVTGEVSLLVLIDAQRSLVDLQDQYFQATAEFFRRRTVLQRALTGTPATGPLPTPAERPAPGQPGSPTGMGRQ